MAVSSKEKNENKFFWKLKKKLKEAKSIDDVYGQVFPNLLHHSINRFKQHTKINQKFPKSFRFIISCHHSLTSFPNYGKYGKGFVCGEWAINAFYWLPFSNVVIIRFQKWK